MPWALVASLGTLAPAVHADLPPGPPPSTSNAPLADPTAPVVAATPDSPPAAPAVPDQAQDIRISFEGYLLDQTEKKVVIRLSFELPGFEWIDADGTLALELEPGRGKVKVTGPDGAERDLEVTARLTRFLAGKGPLARGPEGQRRWPLRGDLYLQARGEKLVELEMGGEVELPPHGQSVQWIGPETLPRGEGSSEAIGRTMLEVHRAGTGGGLLLGGAAWGRPAPPISYMGIAHIVHIETKASTRSAESRDADRLLGRLAYIRDDYARAIGPVNGVILSDAEYGEQTQLAREAVLIADQLRLPAPLREKVNKVRNLVEWKSPPAEVAEACRSVAGELASALVFATTPPDPAPLSEARALFADNCARCHGENGDGKGPAAKDLDPPPRDFHDATYLPLFSPQRAFTAISSGIASTGMPAFESLDARARWTLAFHVHGFPHGQDPAPGREALRKAGIPLPPLDDLASSTDADLTASLKDRLPEADLPLAIAYLRTAGVDEAAKNPVASIKATLRTAVAAYGRDPGASQESLARATAAFDAISDTVRIRNAALADEAARSLAALTSAVRDRKPSADVETLARAALAALRPAEIALNDPAPARGTTPYFAAALAALAALFAAFLGRKYLLRFKTSSGPVLSEKTP